MASHIKRGESLFIPFRNGQSISDSQCKPRMYKSVANFEKSFPAHNHGTKGIEMVEYVEVRHGEWQQNPYCKRIYFCSECGRHIEDGSCNPYEHFPYCHCGAKMNGGKNE